MGISILKSKRNKKVKEQVTSAKINLSMGGDAPFFEYDKNWENKSFRDVVSMLDVKAILFNVPGQPIALANGYSGFLQILEVYGKDIATLSEEEQQGIMVSYTNWLSGTYFDFAEQTTTLPTDTRKQQNNLLTILNQVRYRLQDNTLSDKERTQLIKRMDRLQHNLMILEIVASQQYNTEFFIWIYADTLVELESRVKTAMTLSNGFRPHHISSLKKEMILKQYFNSNEPV